MPFLCVATSQAARNQVRRPRWLPWSTVPAVTETCRAQAAHCRVNRSRPSSQPLSCPQAGQRKPSGQRFSSSQRAQAASSGNLASNSGSDRGSSVIHPPPVCSGTTYSPTGARGMSHWTNSSGFGGQGHVIQVIETFNAFDRKTKAALTPLTITIDEDVSENSQKVWLSRVMFYPAKPDLTEMKQKWDHIAELIPDLGRPAGARMNSAASKFRRIYAPSFDPYG